MSARRGFLGLVGGGASALMGAGRQGVAIRGPGMFPMGMSNPMSASGGPQPEKWKLLDELSRPRQRVQRRAEIQRALTGGWPPGVVCMESNAVWFRAMVAAKRITAEQEAAEDWFSKLRRKVMGDEYG